MRTVAIIQARMGSTRLPGKVMMDLEGKTILDRVVTRVRRATSLSDVVVATTDLPEDDAIVDECNRLGVKFYRGSSEDVLDRYYRAAAASEADAIVRITSDCPLVDPETIDSLIWYSNNTPPPVDYISNVLDYRTYPRGLDVEYVSWSTLETAWKEAVDPAEREHVTLYIYRRPDQFSLSGMRFDDDLSHLRWTVDTPEDLELVRKIYHALGRDDFDIDDVLGVLELHPEWSAINAHIEQKKV